MYNTKDTIYILISTYYVINNTMDLFGCYILRWLLCNSSLAAETKALVTNCWVHNAADRAANVSILAVTCVWYSVVIIQTLTHLLVIAEIIQPQIPSTLEAIPASWSLHWSWGRNRMDRLSKIHGASILEAGTKFFVMKCGVCNAADRATNVFILAIARVGYSITSIQYSDSGTPACGC